MAGAGLRVVALACALAATGAASAQDTKVQIGISGWTGFAPLTLAKEAGIFKKNGLDVTIKKIPQASRHLAIASGDIQCAATTVETWVVWNAAGIATRQIFQLDKSYGADGMAVRANTASIKDLKGKTIAASPPGTSPYFVLAWMLKQNGMSTKDVTIVNLEPAARGASLHRRPERCGSDLRALPVERARRAAGRQDHRHHPRLPDDHGHLRLHAEVPGGQPKAAKALADSYFEAVEMIGKEQAKAYEIMGADVKQTGEQFGNSAKFLRWQDREANKRFFAGEFEQFSNEAADLLLEVGIIKQKPDIKSLVDTRFIQ
jgi:NitT/TauT family transport system substrate-binding protein